MNKIYKVVWSKVKNCYVVVSEIAKNVITGGVKSAKIGKAPLANGLALGALMAFVITGNVWAEDITGPNSSYTGDNTQNLIYADGTGIVPEWTKELEIKDVAGITFEGNGSGSSDLTVSTSEGKITLSNVGNISTNNDRTTRWFFNAQGGTINVTADSIDVYTTKYGVLAQNAGQKGGIVDIVTDGDISFNTGWEGIRVDSRTDAGIGSKVKLDAKNINIETYNWIEAYGSQYWHSPAVYVGSVDGKDSGNSLELIADENITLSGSSAVVVKKGTAESNAMVTMSADIVDLIATEKGATAENNAKIDVTANTINVTTENESSNPIHGVSAVGNSTVDLEGVANITVNNKGAGSAYGVNLENKSTATLGATTITSTSVDGNGFGFRLVSGRETKDGVTTYSGNTVTVNGDANITANGANYAQGIYSQYSDVTFEKNATIKATSTGDYAYAVRMLGDADGGNDKFTNSEITFNGEATSLTASSNGEAFGIYTSGSNDGGANFNGKNVTIDVDGKTVAYGVYAQYDTMAVTSANTTDVSIEASSEGQAYGIYTGEYAGGVGAVDFKGNVTVEAEGGSAYGIEAVDGSSIELGSEGKTVSVTAASTGEAGEAIAVYAGDKSQVGIIGGTLTISATSVNEKQPGSSLQAKSGAVVNVNADTANITGMVYATGEASQVDINVGGAEFESTGNTIYAEKGALIDIDATGDVKIAAGFNKYNVTAAGKDTNVNITGNGKNILTFVGQGDLWDGGPAALAGRDGAVAKVESFDSIVFDGDFDFAGLYAGNNGKVEVNDVVTITQTEGSYLDEAIYAFGGEIDLKADKIILDNVYNGIFAQTNGANSGIINVEAKTIDIKGVSGLIAGCKMNAGTGDLSVVVTADDIKLEANENGAAINVNNNYQGVDYNNPTIVTVTANNKLEAIGSNAVNANHGLDGKLATVNLSANEMVITNNGDYNALCANDYGKIDAVATDKMTVNGNISATSNSVVNLTADTANITGMMYAEGDNSRIDVTANKVANIEGDIFTKDNGVVVLKLKGTNASFTGATNVVEVENEEENTDLTGPVLPNNADEGATLVLESGATWYVTGNSTVNGIIGDEFNVKAAEGVKDAVVTIDGHLPDGIDDDYDDTVSTITGVDFVINEDGDGLGGNVTLNSDSDITINATECGIYSEKDTHVNVKAATLTLNNDEDYDAINANGEVNIDVTNLVFNGKVVADGEGSAVNITTGDFAYDANKQFATENNGVINIAGGNVTGELNVIGGNVNLTAGNVTSVLNVAENSTVTLTGATYIAANLEESITGKGKLVVDGAGVLATTADQVFEVSGEDTITTDADVLAGNTITDIAKEKVTFKSGAVSLNDDYSYDYLTSITDVMKAEKYDGTNASTTKLVMTGNLVTKAEDIVVPEETISADQASNLGNDIELDKVTVEADNNLLIGAIVAEDGSVKIEAGEDEAGNTVHIEIGDSVANGFSANQLKLSEDSTGAVITGNQVVTLGGSEGCDNLVAAGDTDKEVRLVVGTAHDPHGVGEGVDHSHDGTFNIGNELAKPDTEYKLNGSVHVNADSNLNTKGITTITNGVELENGAVNVAKDAHLIANIKVQGDEHSTITGKVTGDLTVDEGHAGAKVHLGNKDYAGKMHAKESILNGATLFLDPDEANDISEASMFTLENASSLDGDYVAGQNSVIAFGVSDGTAVETAFTKTGLTFGNEGNVDSVIYVAGTVDVTNGSITANGGLTAVAANIENATVEFADKSLLIVEADDVSANSAIIGVSTATISDSAKLYIDEAVKGGEYKILAGTDTGWNMENISTNNQLIKFTDTNDSDSEFNVTADVKTVNEVYGDDVIIDKVVDEAVSSNDNQSASDFFNDAVNDKVNASTDAQISAMNDVGSMNELAGVSHTTYAVSNILTDAVADHMSLANGKEHDKDIWAHYVHTKEDVEGLKGAGEYDAQYNGIVVGADLYKEGKATIGAALTYVDGNINGSTLAARTENDAKYYGASIYGSIENKDTAVIADVSYLHGEHDITQRNSGSVITGEPESDAFSVGVRVEKSVKAGVGRLVPYAGARYMHLGTGNYVNSIGLAYDTEDAELFLLPVGLKYSSEVKNTNGWTVRPVVELGYVWAFGDTDTDQTVSLNGASNGFGYDITDSGSYVGRFMLEAERENISYALGYEYQKGDDVKADKWVFNVNWKF